LELVEGEQLALVVATHDLQFARCLSRQCELRKGRLADLDPG